MIGYVLCALGALALLAALVLTLRTRRTMARLDRMLDEAVRGAFRPARYDESRLSRLEARLARALSAGTLSRAKLEADREAIARAVGDISHQTKTPLANIRLYAGLLREQELPGDAGALAARLLAQSERLEFLIQGLVKSSRLETGAVAPAPAPNDAAALLEAVRETYAPAAARKGLTLSAACPDGLRACFDPKWTAEAVGNLVDNAVKYTPSGGHVTLSARRYELFCRVDVADDGPGVPEAELGAVFRRFYRGAAAAQTEGAGLGLYLARQIVSAQGGYVKAASAPGKGTVFSVFLPADGQTALS